MAATCAWRDDEGRWHRSLLHVWRKTLAYKRCARCGVVRSRSW